MSILVSGGAGYIGSHTCVELIQAGYEIVVADNLSNSCEEAVRRVEEITGKRIPFVQAELCHEDEVEALFTQYPDIDSVIHFAGLKAVGESVAKPLEYYSNNLISTLYLLQAMRRHGVKNFVFSSSATVYGDPASVPIQEDFPTGGTTNPYGTDYPTPDGTGVRDYIHVVDLALGHVAALRKLEQNCGLFVCNLGTGNGYSVLEVLHAYEKACGKTLPYAIKPRRPGDIAKCYADPKKAREELGWEAKYGIEEMCASSYKWQSMNPNGYKG